ncbi:uncharacterized protein LOC131657053 [Vicia villosa]|uniref:uncharacterized protein LOC131627337 n=1 Tax=Vicia villosa TaxID=3911 RepID=UPI00273C5E3F|nr:uncharacterized protein LOC131627337 [Vicia villosa]XP_058782545.1 uncharacterized protein LOC131657053 [Vicia villosa]
MFSRQRKRSKSQKDATAAGSSNPPPRAFDALRFSSAIHQDRMPMLEKKKILAERKFVIDTEGSYKEIANIFNAKKWGRLLTPVDCINYEIVREFYANALQPEGELCSYKSFVRGKEIDFSRNAISELLGNPWNPFDPNIQTDEFSVARRTHQNQEVISRVILKPGKQVELNNVQEPIRYNRIDMTPLAQAVLLLIVFNIRPRFHKSSAPLDVALLVYHILENKTVDVAKIIANEMKIFIENTRRPGVHSSAPIIFPCLITSLCQKQGVRFPSVVNERKRDVVDDIYINRYCNAKLAAKKKQKEAGESSAAGEHGETLDYEDWDPRLRASFNYTWDALEAGRRSSEFLMDSMRQLYLHQSAPSGEIPPFPSREDYSAYANWPEGRPFFSEGVDDADAEGDEIGDDILD